MRRTLLSVAALLCWSLFLAGDESLTFADFRKQFVDGYSELGIPGLEYDYRDHLRQIPGEESLKKQSAFFNQQQEQLATVNKRGLSKKEKLELETITYEIDFNLYRINLETAWVKNGRQVPDGGISSMEDHAQWYRYFIQKFTSTDITPEEIFALGKSEVARVQAEIDKIRTSLGFRDNASFYKHLENDSFYITGKDQLIAAFRATDNTVRQHLDEFVEVSEVPPIEPMEWPGAGQYTPPGMYLNHSQNAYGKDVFQFNFYGGRYNRRTIEWLYMHEAIPGHHLQSVFWRNEGSLPFLYPGNFEGWACYVEYPGNDVGLLQDPYALLGKWEWDLVRSARLVIDAGIHYYGWSRQQALDYWKQTIPGQDDIAEREITRVTNWCGQALSYKVGAHYILQMKQDYLHDGKAAKQFHTRYLRSGMVPLMVLKEHIISRS